MKTQIWEGPGTEGGFGIWPYVHIIYGAFTVSTLYMTFRFYVDFESAIKRPNSLTRGEILEQARSTKIARHNSINNFQTKIYIYIHMIYVCVYIYIYIYIYMCVCPGGGIWICSQIDRCCRR